MTDIDTILHYVADGRPCSKAQGERVVAIEKVDKDLAKRIVRAALEAGRGSKTAAAKQLSIGKRTLWRWIDENDWTDIGRGLPNAKLGRIDR